MLVRSFVASCLWRGFSSRGVFIFKEACFCPLGLVSTWSASFERVLCFVGDDPVAVTHVVGLACRSSFIVCWLVWRCGRQVYIYRYPVFVNNFVSRLMDQIVKEQDNGVSTVHADQSVEMVNQSTA